METIVEIKELQGTGEDGFDVVTSEQTIHLGIDNRGSCCETWGHFWCNDNPQEFVGAAVRGVTLTDTALNTKEVEELGSLDGGDVMFVNIETDRGVLQFVAYNSQNGYYGHTARVGCTQLTHQEKL